MNNELKIIYFGMNEFGEECLQYLLNNNIRIAAVVIPLQNRTRGFYKLCKNYNIKLIKLASDFSELKAKYKSINPDLVVICSFSKILPNEIVYFPRLGSINLHPSVLPQYRGAHPIHWALINDEKQTGVSIHYINEKADTGNILTQKVVDIDNKDDINSLKSKLAREGSFLLLETIKQIATSSKKIHGKKQNEKYSSNASKRTPDEGKINWSSNSRDIFNLVRSLKKPYPNAFGFLNKNKIKIVSSFLDKTPGKVLSKVRGHYLIATGDGVILVKTNKPLKIGEVLS